MGWWVQPSQTVHSENYPLTGRKKCSRNTIFWSRYICFYIYYLILVQYEITNTQYAKASETYYLGPGVLTSGFWLSFLMSPSRTWSVAGTSQAQWGRAPVQQTQRQRNQQLHSADHWKGTSTGDQLPVLFFIRTALTTLKLSSGRGKNARKERNSAWVPTRNFHMPFYLRIPQSSEADSNTPISMWGNNAPKATQLPSGNARIQICLTIKSYFPLVTCYGLCLPSPNSYVEALTTMWRYLKGFLWEVIMFRWDHEGRVLMVVMVVWGRSGEPQPGFGSAGGPTCLLILILPKVPRAQVTASFVVSIGDNGALYNFRKQVCVFLC